jgi:NAD-reducing hydrogenase large subunit
VVGVIGKFPDAAVKGIKLRKYGQEIIKALGGKKVHPAYAIPGGVTNALREDDRDRLLAGMDEAYDTCELALALLKDWQEKKKLMAKTVPATR